MQPSKKTRSKRKKFAKWIWDNQVKEIIHLQSDNKCEYCKASILTKQLHCHHIDGRQNMFMLLHLDNLMLLCATHHTLGQVSAHSQSRSGREEFDKWLIKHKRKEFIEELKYLRNNSPKLTLQDLEDRYEEYKELLNNL